jgi:pantetheine-phosphate adenylyltransferase
LAVPHHNNGLAVFPGTFDPITLGHADIIQRARRIFRHLIVAVGHNPEKKPWFTADERVRMVSEVIEGMDNVSVEAYEGLTMAYVRTKAAAIILRGIRDTVDLRDELEAANTNRLVGDVETVFLMTTEQHALTSSTLIKQIVQLGGFDPARLSRLVPEPVAKVLATRFPKKD